jgi:hypothetical protein
VGLALPGAGGEPAASARSEPRPERRSGQQGGWLQCRGRRGRQLCSRSFRTTFSIGSRGTSGSGAFSTQRPRAMTRRRRTSLRMDSVLRHRFGLANSAGAAGIGPVLDPAKYLRSSMTGGSLSAGGGFNRPAWEAPRMNEAPGMTKPG